MDIDRVEHFMGGDAMSPDRSAYASLVEMTPDMPEVERIVRLYIDEGVYFGATLSAYGYYGEREPRVYDDFHDEMKYLTPSAREVVESRLPRDESEQFERIYWVKRDLIEKFYDMGGGHLITLGTDHPSWGEYFSGFSVQRELHVMTLAGLPPAAASRTATLNAARASSRAGRLARGKPGLARPASGGSLWEESRVEGFVPRPVVDGATGPTPVLERPPSHMSRRPSRSTPARYRPDRPEASLRAPRRSLPLLVALATALSLWTSGSARAQQDTAAAETATLRGRVVSAMTGGPLSNAAVRIDGSRRGAITDSAGRFTIAGLPAGEALVSVSHPGFEEKTVPIELRGGTVSDVTLLLSETVLRLEAIDVTVERPARYAKLEGFEERRRMGLGHFIGPEEIEEKTPERPSDLLRDVPGVRVSPGSYGRASVEISRQSPPCPPALYIDGIHAPGAEIDDLNALDLLAVEVYRGSSEIPVAYARTAGRCGIVLVWTRTGEGRE